jgi:flavodoxin I
LKPTGIFYGTSSGKTESVATRIYQHLGKGNASLWDVAESRPEDVLSYDKLIFGIPTWGIGELQDDWALFLPELEDLDLSGKSIALFGLGDQESYPDTFADALGILYDALLCTGCKIIGSWCTLGYEFIESAAVRNGEFAGLVLDEENQPQLTDLRINDWLGKIVTNWKNEPKSN